MHPKLYFSFHINLRCLLCSDCLTTAVLRHANGCLKSFISCLFFFCFWIRKRKEKKKKQRKNKQTKKQPSHPGISSFVIRRFSLEWSIKRYNRFPRSLGILFWRKTFKFKRKQNAKNQCYDSLSRFLA